MKKLTALALCLLLVLCACAEDAGNTQTTQASQPDETKTIYVYDVQKQEITVGDSTTTLEMRYIYDERGFLSAIEAESNGESTTMTVECNEDGMMTKTVDATTNQSMEYTYDAQGRLLTFTAMMNGETINRTSYTYDADGNMVKQEVVYEMMGTTTTSVNVYENGVLVRAESYQGEALTYITTMQYNAQGQRTEAVQTSEAGQVLAKTAYTYDAQGNMTEAVQYTYTGSGQEEPVAVTRILYTYKAIQVPVDSPRVNT